MPYNQNLLVIMLGISLFIGGILGGIVIQNYLSLQSGTQNNNGNTSHENLTITSYTPRLFTNMAVEFNLTNTGTTNIEIEEVKLNGQLNQTTENLHNGWNGTTSLNEGESGSIYVYIPCYRDVINSSMPQIPTYNPSQRQMEEFETWAWNYTCTFAFITHTQHEYEISIKGLGFGLKNALIEYSDVFIFTNTEQVQITSMTFGTNWIALIANNTGTTPVTISTVYLNNAATPITTFAAGQSPGVIAANGGAVINMTTTVTNGYNYQVKLVSSKGNSFLYSAVAPSS